MTKGARPEIAAPPEVFYNEEEARKYTTNSRMMAIQAQLTERALELLALPDDGRTKLLLDLGCGSGLSGEALTEQGHCWVGMDISEAMLDVAREREVEGDLCLHDLGDGLPFRTGTFDGAISISAVQWLCNADRQGADPRRRMRRFFETLYSCLTRGGRAVLQIYPANSTQAEMLTSAAMRAGFSGGLVVDFPHSTRAKKYFLVLMVGGSAAMPAPKGMSGEASDEEAETVAMAGRQQSKRRRVGSAGAGFSSRHPEAKGKGWILKKKEQARHKGYVGIPSDTKYTGRKRKTRF
ncbi:probable 18S rRNA (guanine-N(7))-methyltransferase [Coccomyxa sp. Obi]|nr:probable 18S rRNA (guanine-N(7))-methyltransferase [Coccomyxa sp. Obi]